MIIAASGHNRMNIRTRIVAKRRAPLEFLGKRRAVQTHRVGVLFDEHAGENAAGQLAEIARFDRLQVTWIDLGFIGQACPDRCPIVNAPAAASR